MSDQACGWIQVSTKGLWSVLCFPVLVVRPFCQQTLFIARCSDPSKVCVCIYILSALEKTMHKRPLLEALHTSRPYPSPPTQYTLHLWIVVCGCRWVLANSQLQLDVAADTVMQPPLVKGILGAKPCL